MGLDKKTISTTEIVGGMGMLLLGHKAKGLSMFGHGLYGLEEVYREDHPHLEPGFKARWEKAIEFYDATHQEETNRSLHRWGIPFIVGGAIGLIAAKPHRLPWSLSAASFALGWALNIVGHGIFEKNKPAFTDDPLSFIAGPVWDAQQMLGSREKTIGQLEEKVTITVEDHV